MSFRIALLGKQDRRAFASGAEMLDRYFRERVTQDVRRRITACFIALDDDGDNDGAIAGFYTLAATSLLLDALPPERARGLPRYPVVPAVLLGRLAVATAYQGKRLGGALVADALLRAAQSEVMAHAMLVEAKDEQAARFYEHLGFARLIDDRLRLIRPLASPA